SLAFCYTLAVETARHVLKTHAVVRGSSGIGNQHLVGTYPPFQFLNRCVVCVNRLAVATCLNRRLDGAQVPQRLFVTSFFSFAFDSFRFGRFFLIRFQERRNCGFNALQARIHFFTFFVGHLLISILHSAALFFCNLLEWHVVCCPTLCSPCGCNLRRLLPVVARGHLEKTFL